MATIDLVMPKMGESIMEATILKWLKQPGDSVQMDETVLEVATDKVDSEVPSIAEGVLQEVLYKVDDVVPVGAVIARISSDKEPAAKEESTSVPLQAESRSAPLQSSDNQPYPPLTTDYNHEVQPMQATHSVSGGRFYSPLVLNIAAQEGVSLADLEKLPGTGNEGRVTKKDILQYVSRRNSGQKPDGGPRKAQELIIPAHKVEVSSPAAYTGNVEIIEMDRMRRLIADHMVRSKQTSPHVTSFTEADVTNLVLWRDRVKHSFEKREGTKITFTPLFIEAIIRCIKKFPLINSSLDGHNIIVKKDINIGMAAALPSGNLIVPVIKNADTLNLTGLARQVNNLADAARNNKLKPEDIADGTFTLTNIGTFGSLMGVPIINQPQVAILAVGAIKKRPVVIETPAGDSIAIRHMMYLSMSYDHRIIDGALGSTFLTAVAKELEGFDVKREG